MKSMFLVLFGLVSWFFLVGKPVGANLAASLAIRSGIDSTAQAQILETAESWDHCNEMILEKAGDNWFEAKKYTMAAYAYGRAMICSPANSVDRIKYGESVFAMGYSDGIYHMQDAMRLEPYNPIYQREIPRILKTSNENR